MRRGILGTVCQESGRVGSQRSQAYSSRHSRFRPRKMADQHEDAQDAITADEMSGTAIPGRTSVPQNQGGRSANACK